jgi:3-keto-disaccharide hydrolase
MDLHMTRVNRVSRTTSFVFALALVAAPRPATAQTNPPPPILGRWDLTVADSGGRSYPSWLEVTSSGRTALVGRFVGRAGSARPIGRVDLANDSFSFAIPPQWEAGTGDLRLEGKIEGDKLTGTIVNPAGDRHTFTGTRAPSLIRASAPVWGEPIMLFNGKDLTGWTKQGDGESKWTVVNGVLTDPSSGANLMTTRTFGDFKLHLEFRYPKNGNSGVYLRGRHEVQIEDSPKGEFPLSVHLGGVYGFLWPNENAGAGPGQWNTYDITLIGRRVTVVLNGKTVIADQIIPGPTGEALDSNEGAPGPILLQGNHTAVEYRNIRLTPAK